MWGKLFNQLNAKRLTGKQTRGTYLDEWMVKQLVCRPALA